MFGLGGGGVAQTRPGPGVPPDCSLVFSVCSACLKDMEILGFYLLGEKDSAGIRDVFVNDICI